MTEPAFIKFINAVIKNLPDKIYPDPNNLSIGVSVAKFNGTIVEKFDLLRKDGKLLLASNTKTKAFYEKNVIRFDRLHFKPYSDVIINQMITSNNLLDSIVKSDVGKGYLITEKLATVFTLVHELLHTYYPLTISSSLATSHEQMARAAKAALAELGIVNKMTIMRDYSNYFNAALLQVCGGIKL